MDEKTLNELLECSVCLERLDSTSKVLPCQHTFCCRCLEEIVSSNSKNELRCPECRYLVEIPKISDLPNNLLLIRLLEGLKTSGGTTDGNTKCNESSPVSVTTAKNQSLIKKPVQAAPCAKALYNYEAREPGDLSFKKGDVVLLRKQVDENWYHGELGILHGFFPATYVQVITPLPHQELPKCTALYDFVIDDENEKDCLTFRKDEVLTVIRRVDGHWAEGKHGDRIGIFPISFVDLNDAAKWLINDQARLARSSTNHHVNHQSSEPNTVALNSEPEPVVPSTSTSPESSDMTTFSRAPAATTVGILITTAESVQSPNAMAVTSLATFPTGLTSFAMHHRTDAHPKRHSLTLVGHPHLSACTTTTSSGYTSKQRHSVELGNSRVIAAEPGDCVTGIVTTAESSVSSNGVTSESTRSKPMAVPSSGIYKAVYNYKPQKDDEVELAKGRYYIVSEKCQDGWFKGTCLTRGDVGVFPGNYVQMVKVAASVQGGLSPVNGTTTALVNNTHLTSSAAAAMCSVARANSLLSRNHSFPKTSPYHLNPENHRHIVNHTAVKVPSRTITNVTQALSRSGAAQSHVSNTSSTKTTQTDTHTEGVTSSIVSPAPSSDRSHVCSNPGATTHSPKSGRRHHKQSSRHASIRTTLVPGPALDRPQSSSCLQGAGDSGQEAGPSTQQQHSIWVVSGSRGTPDHNTTVSDTATPDRTRTRDKQKDRRDKRSESLLKRLASAGIPLKGRKARSPPPELCARKEHRHSTPQGSLYRSGSEGSLVEGAVGAVCSSPPNHSHRKALERLAKIKPLPREKYRCITPYPAQSDMELELRAGDSVYVHKKRDDGWFKGTVQRNGKSGLFPCSFVEKV